MATLEMAIPRAHIRAALICAGDRDIRSYLNGLCVELHADRVNVIGCDGHRALICKSETQTRQVNEMIKFIIDRDMLKAIKANGPAEIFVQYDTDSKKVTLTDGLATYTRDAIDERYPDWRRIMPKETSGESAQFNPAYIGDLGKIAKILGSKYGYAHIAYNGQDGAVATFDNAHVIGIVMPLRNSVFVDGIKPDASQFI